jgi:predicted nucleic acid-binding protein
VTDVLVDTNVFIDLIRGARPLISGRDRISYSVITRVELFAGDADQERHVRELLSPLDEILVDDPIAERAGRLRHDRRMKLADAIIAATALEHRLTLVTRNARDFQRVRGLKVRSPA